MSAEASLSSHGCAERAIKAVFSGSLYLKNPLTVALFNRIKCVTIKGKSSLLNIPMHVLCHEMIERDNICIERRD